MFYGQHPYLVDDRNRIPIPPDFREEFESGAFFVPGDDGCINMHTRAGWEDEAIRLKGLPSDSQAIRDAQRRFTSHTYRSPRDAQGRVVIPQPLIDMMGLGKNVVIIGRFDTIEIWDRAAWQAREPGLDEALRSVRERRAQAESPEIVGRKDG